MKIRPVGAELLNANRRMDGRTDMAKLIRVNNQPDALFMYLFIYFISLHVSSIKCSSSGDRVVLIHHLV